MYTPDTLAAIEAIRQLKARYFRFLDTCNLDAMESVFTPDLEVCWRGGDYEIALSGWPELRRFYEQAFTKERFGMHTAHHPEIHVNGAEATGTWYLHDIFFDTVGKNIVEGSALYEDDYVLRDGAWKVHRCRYNRLLEFSRPLPDDLRISKNPLDWKTSRP